MTVLKDLRNLLYSIPGTKGEVIPDALLREDLELDEDGFNEIVAWLEFSYGLEPWSYRVESIRTVGDLLRLIHERRALLQD
jgi:acyl carrier protein